MDDDTGRGGGDLTRARSFLHGFLDELGPSLVGAALAGRSTELKRDGSLVTSADVATNERFVAAVRAAFPGHEVVSEELDTCYRGADWCWIIDPIDGTTNFVNGLPLWGVSVALAVEGELALGAVDAPAIGMRFAAERGAGAQLNGAPTRVSDVDWDDAALVEHGLLTVSSGVGRRYAVDLPLMPRSLGCASVNLALVGSGAVVGSLQTGAKLWDVAAGLLVVAEAGGHVELLRGEPLLPLATGTDYGRRPTWFVAAASAASARRIVDGVVWRGQGSG